MDTEREYYENIINCGLISGAKNYYLENSDSEDIQIKYCISRFSFKGLPEKFKNSDFFIKVLDTRPDFYTILPDEFKIDEKIVDFIFKKFKDLRESSNTINYSTIIKSTPKEIENNETFVKFIKSHIEYIMLLPWKISSKDIIDFILKTIKPSLAAELLKIVNFELISEDDLLEFVDRISAGSALSIFRSLPDELKTPNVVYRLFTSSPISIFNALPDEYKTFKIIDRYIEICVGAGIELPDDLLTFDLLKASLKNMIKSQKRIPSNYFYYMEKFYDKFTKKDLLSIEDVIINNIYSNFCIPYKFFTDRIVDTLIEFWKVHNQLIENPLSFKIIPREFLTEARVIELLKINKNIYNYLYERPLSIQLVYAAL